MNYKHLCLAIGFLFLLPFLFSIETAGAETRAQKDFITSCAPCHGPTPKYPLLGARLGYEHSGHKLNDNSYYANGTGCQKCHTNEGFIDFIKTGKVDPKSYIAYPSQPNCVTCHTMHETWDFSLRTTKPVKLQDGSSFDIGDGNLCANCHHARRDVTTQVKASDANKVRSYWGAHHGPQSDLVNGSNAYEYPGKKYSSSPHKEELGDGCIGCHMSLPEGRYSSGPQVGGHSFNIVGNVHGSNKINVSGCINCHDGIKQVPGTTVFDIMAKADFDRDGKVEPAQLEVQGLLDKFVNKRGSGYFQTMAPPMFKKGASATFGELGSGWANSKKGKWSKEQIGALWNYKLIVEDRSLGVHNLTYTVQVLYDSIKSLDPKFNDSLRPK